MAGAAGRSRGCATCRLRKIKCDLQKPSCSNCLRSSRVCQGYERHDVFVNRTPAGMRKRKQLEEVKDQRLEVIKTALVAGAFSPTPVVPMSTGDNHVNWFYRHFVVPRTDPRLASFMAPVMSIAVPGPLLGSSLKALSIMKYGKLTNDLGATQQGQNLYGRSLGKLRLALTDPTASKSDETLACAVTLGLYELLNVAPSFQSGGWFKHMTGLGRLIEHRGPKQSQSPVCLQIFEVCRQVLMTRCLLDRQSSVFGRREWLEIPWQGRTKPRDEKICDAGFRISSYIAQTDKVLSNPQHTEIDLENLLLDYNALFEDIEALHRNCSCSQAMSAAGQNAVADRRSSQQNIWSLVQCALLTAIQLASCIMGDVPYQRLQEMGDSQMLHRPTTLRMRDDFLRNELARSISDLCGICIPNDPTPGPLLRIMWSMKLASTQLQASPVEPFTSQCEARLGKVINAFPSTVARLQSQKAS